jgi:hypothetical protein
MDSILTSVKKKLGVTPEHTEFDSEIVDHINSVFADLAQMGVGPSKGFSIVDDTAIWDDFIYDSLLLQSVKSYVFLRVKILFDSASMGSATLASYERQISQWEWRLTVAAESERTNETL